MRLALRRSRKAILFQPPVSAGSPISQLKHGPRVHPAQNRRPAPGTGRGRASLGVLSMSYGAAPSPQTKNPAGGQTGSRRVRGGRYWTRNNLVFCWKRGDIGVDALSYALTRPRCGSRRTGRAAGRGLAEPRCVRTNKAGGGDRRGITSRRCFTPF